MARPTAGALEERGLDFLIQTEHACRGAFAMARSREGESAWKTVLHAFSRDLAFAHDLPMQRLNDTLKNYTFVDPAPLDKHLSQIVLAFRDWVSWIIKPDWLAEIAHHIAGALARQTSDPGPEQFGGVVEVLDLDMEHLGRFVFPVPCKLRDLQAMVRHFSDTRSNHHIAGLDAIVSEVVRTLLQTFNTVHVWDDLLVAKVGLIAQAVQSGDQAAKRKRIVDLCVLCNMDVFEASHRLSRIDASIFEWSHSDTENVCQKLPLHTDRQLLHGPPCTLLGANLHDDAAGNNSFIAHQPSSSSSADESEFEEFLTPAEGIRRECLSWWHEQRFFLGAPTRIFANSLLTFLVDNKLHPDPFVAEMTPRVLERLFGAQISCNCFMNRLLPLLGGYSDSGGCDVPSGQGFPLLSDPSRCAESLLVFLRQWTDLVLGDEEEEHARRSRSKDRKLDSRRREGLDLDAYMQELLRTGHSSADVVDMLEGARALPGDGIVAPPPLLDGGRRYRVTEEMTRMWELISRQHYDVLDTLEEESRDMGPYIHLDLSKPAEVAELVGHVPDGAWSIVHPEVIASARSRSYLSEHLSGDDPVAELEAALAPSTDASDTFALYLAEWPPEWGPEAGGASSTFIRFFAQEGRRISRAFLQGLPQLPWCLGSDARNTVIVDIPQGDGVADFHCVFAQAASQPHRVVVTALGDHTSPTYIICPKYQPLPVKNGDRLVCHQWTFEFRLEKIEGGMDSLSLLTDEGTILPVPREGCHLGAGSRSRKLEYQPFFPSTKISFTHRLRGMNGVHVVLQYHACAGRWSLIDHSHDPLGAMLLLRPGVAYPLSDGLRLKLGPLIMQVGCEKGAN